MRNLCCVCRVCTFSRGLETKQWSHQMFFRRIWCGIFFCLFSSFNCLLVNDPDGVWIMMVSNTAFHWFSSEPTNKQTKKSTFFVREWKIDLSIWLSLVLFFCILKTSLNATVPTFGCMPSPWPQMPSRWLPLRKFTNAKHDFLLNRESCLPPSWT